LRHVLALETLPDYGTVVQKCFDEHIQQHTYNADQLRFLSVMRTVLVKKRALNIADLYEGDFTVFGDNAVALMLINQLHQFMGLINPASRRLNVSNDSVGIIDHPVIFIPWPSFESPPTH